MEITRLFDYMAQQATERPDQAFLASKVTENGEKKWKSYTFKEVADISDRVSQALLNLGIKKDDKVALCAPNRPEWNFIDIGCQQIGATLVPLYPTASINDFRFIFTDAEIKLAFVGDKGLYQKIQQIAPEIPSLTGVYTFDEVEGAKNWKSLIEAVTPTAAVQSAKDAVNEKDLATIIYTSGTTGNPKGVMLSHYNMVSNLKSTDEILPFHEGGKSLSFLPLSHIYERIGFFAYLKNAIYIHYAENMETIAENLKEVHPFVFATVPRLLEKVYEKIMEKGNDLTGFKKKLFDWSLDLGNRYELNTNLGLWYNLQLAIARKLVFSKWQEALGGEVKFIITGAAPLQARLGRLFSAAGVIVLEGYGLSEASPGLSVTRVEESGRMIGTVGPPLPGVEIKLAEDGEILARGPNIMMGYYKRPDLTAEVIDSEGYLHTGDIGEWVNGKFLKITDRKKELFKTSGGKYVAPAPIENKLKESRYIEQVMLVGDNMKFVTALVVPSFLHLQAWAKEHNIPYNSNQQMVGNEKIKALINAEIDHTNKEFGHVEQVKKFELLDKEWTIEDGELTPTLKVKRKVILSRYEKLVEGMYN
ncbi:MAG: long-chain fatty acid--CoA ligase [Bacteroidetes bacterium]|nr:long-chain fatty acid--CoA ligase [Bacteroidota bacterium]